MHNVVTALTFFATASERKEMMPNHRDAIKVAAAHGHGNVRVPQYYSKCRAANRRIRRLLGLPP